MLLARSNRPSTPLKRHPNACSKVGELSDFTNGWICGERQAKTNWLKVNTVGVKSNRSGIGARMYCTTQGSHRQMNEVRSGGSYISQNDLRVHFGLDKATSADLEVNWPSGVVDRFRAAANEVVTVVEGKRKVPRVSARLT